MPWTQLNKCFTLGTVKTISVCAWGRKRIHCSVSSTSSSLKSPNSQRAITIWPQRSCHCWCPVTKWRYFLWRNGEFKLRLSILRLPPLFLSFSILRSLLQAPKGNSDCRRSKPFQVFRHSSVSVVNSLTFIVLVTGLLRKPADTASSVCPMGESSVSGTNRLFPLSLCTRFTEISQGKLFSVLISSCVQTPGLSTEPRVEN